MPSEEHETVDDPQKHEDEHVKDVKEKTGAK